MPDNQYPPLTRQQLNDKAHDLSYRLCTEFTFRQLVHLTITSSFSAAPDTGIMQLLRPYAVAME